MGPYKLLFSVHVEHTFFPEDLPVDFDFRPTSRTSLFLQKTGLLLKKDNNGVRLFFDQNDTAALQYYTSEDARPFRFEIVARPKDSYFHNYTEISRSNQDEVLFCSNWILKDRPFNGRCLHKDEFVSEAEFLPLSSPQLENTLNQVNRLVKPFCIISIALGKQVMDCLHQTRDDQTNNYLIRLRARETYWEYLVCGISPRKPISILDQDKVMEFEATGESHLSNGRIARTFRSKKRIALRHHSDCRFMLKETNTNGGKVIIRRLPVASIKQFAKQRIHGEEALVSEIFINT
jgi:hypothetical protein